MLTISTPQKKKILKKKFWMKEKKIKRGTNWNILEYSNSRPHEIFKIDE
jgi:hypothetical protein